MIARLPCAFILAAVLLPLGAAAQPAEQANQNVTVLQLQEIGEKAPGRIAAAETSLASAEHRYSVQDLDVMQPVAVGLFATDPARSLRVQVVKGEWDQVFRDCSTDATGRCELRFRTQGNFGLRVTPSGPTPAAYRVAVWVGDEVQNVPANLITPAAAGASWGGWLQPTVLAGTLGILALAGIGGWLVMRGRRKVGA